METTQEVEGLVVAGDIIMQTAVEKRVPIIPVDSEHSAIFQALGADNLESVKDVTITASGGAFRDWPLERLAAVVDFELFRPELEAALKRRTGRRADVRPMMPC